MQQVADGGAEPADGGAEGKELAPADHIVGQHICHDCGRKQGMTFRQEMFLVPRLNFPEGLPPALSESEIAPDQQEIFLQQAGTSIDKPNFVLLDGYVPRKDCGNKTCGCSNVTSTA